ncbi:MAG: hypothetical protein ACYDHC_04715 [Desulfuromonadaceae bacterium]
MTNKTPDLYLSIAAFALYITGGFGIFGGIALVILMRGQDLFGWGDAKTIGYLLMCVGVCFSIMGVLFIRLVRNKTNMLLSQGSKSNEKQ